MSSSKPFAFLSFTPEFCSNVSTFTTHGASDTPSEPAFLIYKTEWNVTGKDVGEMKWE